MAVSEVSIINDALGELGEPVIVNRNDNTAQANAADRFFDQAKEEFLEESHWRFAIKEQQLAQSATAPEFKYSFRYALPSDFIRMVEINEVDVQDVRVPLWGRVGDFVHTDETEVKIQYVYTADVSTFTPRAATALAFLMAAKMSRLLTDSATQKQEMLEGYGKALKMAKASDAMAQKQPIENRAASSAFILAHIASEIPRVTSTPSAL